MDLEKKLTISRKAYIGLILGFMLVILIFGLLDLRAYFSWTSVTFELLMTGILAYGIFSYQLKMLDKPVAITWIGFVFTITFCLLLLGTMFFL
ncbi:MAG: hypothetical protein Sapg2KO_46620 [Saprospiraceae bacterium]